MKTKLPAYLMALITFFCAIPYCESSVWAKDELTVYVSTDGNDNNNGGMSSPFKTIEKAVAVLEESERSVKKVYIREGTYYVKDSIEIGADNIEIAAYSNEDVEILGAVKLNAENFTAVTDDNVKKRLPQESADKVLEFDLTGYVKSFPEYQLKNHFNLYTDGVKQTLARYPNITENEAVVKEVINPLSNFVPDFDVTRFSLATSMLVSGRWYVDWLYETFWVTSVDAETNSLFLRDESSYDYGIKQNKSFFAFNMLEGIDIPGEWYVDVKAKKLYYYPTDNFYTSGSTYLTAAEGPIFELEDGVSNVKISNISVKYGKSDAIAGKNNKNIIIDGCKIEGFGGYGIKLENVSDSVVSNGEIKDTTYAVYLTGGDIVSLAGANNKITQMNISDFSDIGIRVAGRGCVISENTLSDSPNRGIDITKAADVTIEYNEIYNVCRERGDVGAVYVGRGFVYRGNVIRCNYVHDIYSDVSDDYVVGIYLDDQISGVTVYGNVVKNTCVGILSGGGKDNRIYNNIIMDVDKYTIVFDQRGVNGDWQAEQNKPGGVIYNETYAVLNDENYDSKVWYEKYPEFESTVSAFENDNVDAGLPDNNYIANNIYCGSKSNGFYNISAKVKANWQNGSAYPVKMTVDEIKFNGDYDYSLKEESKVFTTLSGFENIPFSEIGADSGKTVNVEDLYVFSVPDGSEKVSFISEKARGALKYEFNIYKDKKQSEIVLSKTVKQNYCTQNLGKGKYWIEVKAFGSDGTLVAKSDVNEIDVLGEYIVYYGFDSDNTGELERKADTSELTAGVYFAGANASGTSNAESKAEIVSETLEDGSVNNYVQIIKDDSARPGGMQIKLPQTLTSGVYEYGFDVRFDNHSCRFDTNTFGSTSGYFDFNYMSHNGTVCSQGFVNYKDSLQFAGCDVKYLKNSEAQWESVKVIIDLDNDYSVYYFDGEYVAAKKTGTSDSTNQNILYLNFMPTYYKDQNGTATGEGVYSIDNVYLKNISNSIASVTPRKDSTGTALNTEVNAAFKYPITGIENISVAVTENDSVLSEDVDYTLAWNGDMTEMNIRFAEKLNEDTLYEIKIGDMVITRFRTGDFLVMYDFEDFEEKELKRGHYEPTGKIPAIYFEGENSSGTSNTESKAEIATEALGEETANKVLKVTKDSSARIAGAQIKLPEAITAGIWEYTYDVKFVNHSRSFAYNTFGSTSGSFDYVYMSLGGSLCSQGFYNYDDNILQLADAGVSYSKNSTAQWEKVKVVIDLDDGVAAYYFNGVCLTESVIGTKSIRYLNFMPMYYETTNGGASGNGVYCIDNITLKKIEDDFEWNIVSIKDTETKCDLKNVEMANKEAEITLSLINNTTMPRKATVFLSVYENDLLVACEHDTIDITVGENTVTLKEKVPNIATENICVKAFLFDDWCRPIAEELIRY